MVAYFPGQLHDNEGAMDAQGPGHGPPVGAIFSESGGGEGMQRVSESGDALLQLACGNEVACTHYSTCWEFGIATVCSSERADTWTFFTLTSKQEVTPPISVHSIL